MSRPDSEDRTAEGEVVIETFNDASAFEHLRPEWEELRQRGEEQDPFLNCAWVSTWWRAFGRRRTLYLVTARRRGRLLAVLPMMLERNWRHGVPLRRLVSVGNHHTPRFDLVRASDDEDVYRAIWNQLLTLRDKWDVLDFPRLSAGSVTTSRFVRLARESGVQYSLWQRAPQSPWVDIRPSWDEYAASLSASFRKALRRKMRKLSELGQVGLETLTSPHALEQGLADGLLIDAEGCKGPNRTAISSQPEVEYFYTELTAAMAARSQLRLHFLTLDGTRIAFDYSVISNRCLYSLKAGYLPAHAGLSPGTVLLDLILRRAHEEGLVGVDLLGDTDEFKMHWTDVTRKHQWLHCYSNSLRGRFSNAVKCRLLPGLRRALGI